MAKDLPAGFDRNKILIGLHKAMEFGEPTRAEDQATFVTIVEPIVIGPVDEDGVPFDPSERVSRTPQSNTVACAVEYVDRADRAERFGTLQPTRVKITLLDAEYQTVRGFDYVVVGGDKYVYRSTEPPVALGSIDVWTVYCTAEDES